MSIYPVRLSEWFPPGDDEHEIIKILTYGSPGCLNCKKKRIHWQEAIGHHALPYGYGDIWCRQKCFRNWLKKEK